MPPVRLPHGSGPAARLSPSILPDAQSDSSRPCAAARLAGCTMNLRAGGGAGRQRHPHHLAVAEPGVRRAHGGGRVRGGPGMERAPTARMRRGLARIGARPEDVTDVFVTHSHRDHIMAWRTGAARALSHDGGGGAAVSGRAGARRRPLARRPRRAGDAGPVARRGGRAAVFARHRCSCWGRTPSAPSWSPGHTPGSTAYLHRGVLFAGDAISRAVPHGLRPGDGHLHRRQAASHDALVSLFERLRPYDVQWVCTAHAKCARPDERFIRKVLR